MAQTITKVAEKSTRGSSYLFFVVAATLTGFDPEATGDINPDPVVPFELVLENSRSIYVNTYAIAAESNQ